MSSMVEVYKQFPPTFVEMSADLCGSTQEQSGREKVPIVMAVANIFEFSSNQKFHRRVLSYRRFAVDY
jgi:hypothetical protein